MLAICSICVSKFVSTSKDITSTPCGHIFHYACILQWLQTSKSCPQCRNKTSERSLLKLYFDIQTNSTQEDIGSVHNHNDALQFQISLKDTEIKNANSELKTTKEHNEGIKKECVKLNNASKAKDAIISELKMQASYLKGGVKDLELAKKRAKKAETTLKTLELVQKIYFSKYEDIENVIKDCGNGSNMAENLSSLAIISVIMQKKLTDASKEKSKSADENVALKMKLRNATKSISVKDLQIQSLENRVDLLEADISHLESENSRLSQKVAAMRDAIITPSGSAKNKVINRLLTENVVPESFKKFKNGDESISEISITPEVIRTKPKESMPPPLKNTNGSAKTSPYIRLKSSSVNPFATFNMKTQCAYKKTASSPVISKSKIHQFPPSPLNMDFGYDGLGGHHKVDNFPQSKPMINKFKRVNIVHKGKYNSTKIIPVQKINDYFKNTFDD